MRPNELKHVSHLARVYIGRMGALTNIETNGFEEENPRILSLTGFRIPALHDPVNTKLPVGPALTTEHA